MTEKELNESKFTEQEELKFTEQELNELKLEFSKIPTKELKSYRNWTKFMSIIFNKTAVFIFSFIIIFSVSLLSFFKSGSYLIFIIVIGIHFICYNLILKSMPNLEKDGEECRIINKMIKEELSNRKYRK